jgi:hypothetical protein
MNPKEQLQRLLKVKDALPAGAAAGLLDSAIEALPFTPEEHARVDRGIASEGRFAQVFSGLDWTAMIHALDQWQLPLSSKETWQVPDHLIFVATPGRSAVPVLVETKLVSGQKVTFEISTSLLDALQRYADTVHMPLLIGVFWEKLHLWTTHTPDQLSRSEKAAKVSLETATHSDVSVIFSDTLLLIDKHWRRRTTFDPSAEGYHLRHPDRGFIVEDHLATDGENFVQLTEVESGIINRIMRSKVTNTEKQPGRSVVTTESTEESVAKATSIIHLLLEELEVFGEEGAPSRAFDTLARLKLSAGIPIRPFLPQNNTQQVQSLFESTFGISWERIERASDPDAPRPSTSR